MRPNRDDPNKYWDHLALLCSPEETKSSKSINLSDATAVIAEEVSQSTAQYVKTHRLVAKAPRKAKLTRFAESTGIL